VRSSGRRANRPALGAPPARGLATAALLWAALGCSTPQSFVILLLQSSTGAPVAGVDRVTVVVSKTSGPSRTLTYPAGDLTIPADASASMGTLSVGFSGDQTGDVTFQVQALDVRGCPLGTGTTIITLKKGATVEGIVPLGPGPACRTDGGTADGAPGRAFPGCDPARPVCAGGQTCQVNCTAGVNACTPGGTGAPWTPCQSNADCAPGSQCFDYATLGCAVKVCLRFCDTDGDCGATPDGGPASLCRDPVVCAGGATPYHTCSASCDPTAAARTAGRSGCPAGLACVLPASNDQVACACPEASRTGVEGTPCSASAGCAPGLVCEQTCRAICRCELKNGACAAANDCPTAGTSCAPLPGETLYGVCL
jgi:hypothetical protein